MKILIVGAGAVGGYYGGRLLEKGENVTFLVRQKRKEQLLKDGLVVESANGDFTIQPKLVVAGQDGQYDVILIGTKAYQLSEAIEAVKPFAHKDSVILPMLNGIDHIKQLQEAFSVEQVIGGVCFIESTITNDGVIKQTSSLNHLVFGELNGEMSERIKQINDAFSNTKAIFKLSDSIMTELWNKYLFIATMSGVTTLFRQPVGPIRDCEEGASTIKSLINEIATVMNADGASLAGDVEALQFDRFMSLQAGMKSSMQRDMERGSAVEVDHIQGYILDKARNHQVNTPILTSIYANLKVYENAL